MTHPDIKYVEKYGYPEAALNHGNCIGKCLLCGNLITEQEHHVESIDGVFCNMDCCMTYYCIVEK